MHFIFYEDLKRAYLGGQLEKLAKFLGTEVSKELERALEILEHRKERGGQ